MKNFKLDKIILDATNSLGDIRKRVNLMTVISVLALVIAVIAILK